jgi:hypothetical protein
MVNFYIKKLICSSNFYLHNSAILNSNLHCIAYFMGVRVRFKVRGSK